MCKCTHAGHEVDPQAEQALIFRTVFAYSGFDLEVYLDGDD